MPRHDVAEFKAGLLGGKTTAAAELKRLLDSSAGLAGQQAVVVVDEPSLHLERNAAYRDARSEKDTRGVIKSAVDRSTNKDTVVILDSLCSIKGYRYELWCIARASGTRYCVLHCDTPVDTCRAWNNDRSTGDAYETSVFEDLVGRFERPDGKNRWESPLVTLCPPVAAGSSADDGRAFPGSTERVAGGGGSDVAAVHGRKGRQLVPTVATQQQKLSETNLLYELDQAAQEVVALVVEAQSAAGGGAPPGGVLVGQDLPPLRLGRALSLPELRRQKRNFIKLVRAGAGATPPDSAAAVRRMFCSFLQCNCQDL